MNVTGSEAAASEPQRERSPIVIATIGMLAGFFFFSAQYEKQLWLLLGVCAGVATIARSGTPFRD